MKLYVIRHGVAVDSGAPGADETRPLTREGRERLAEVARGLAVLDIGFDVLIHSPMLRAVQTAEMFAPLVQGSTRVSAALAASPSESLLAECVGDSVALVGHEPWLSELIAWLVTGQRELGPHFALGKGALAVLEGKPWPGEMSMTAFLPPDCTRRLRR